jgi:hypothetical protein
MTLRRRPVEPVFGRLEYWMGPTRFLTRRLANVGTGMSPAAVAGPETTNVGGLVSCSREILPI